MLLRSNFSSFPHYFIYILVTSGVKLHIHLLNVVVQFIVFLTLSTLICRGTDISKYFSESLGIRDNESRLYILYQFWFSLSDTLTVICVKVSEIYKHLLKIICRKAVLLPLTYDHTCKRLSGFAYSLKACQRTYNADLAETPFWTSQMNQPLRCAEFLSTH